MRYFVIMNGLRGCYMPDSVYTLAVKTRSELKSALESEYDFATDCEDEKGDYPPRRRREIASAAAALWRRSWRDRDSHLSTVIPTTNGSGIQVNPVSRVEYLASKESEE